MSSGTPSISSGTHPDEDVWYSADDVTLGWTEPTDTGSGVDGYSYTLEEVGHIFKVTRERIRQIEAKALRKLRHPSRAEHLRSFIGEE